MGIILNLETATNICSVALAKEGEVISILENDSKNSHASQITLFIEKAMQQANLPLKDLDAIAVSKGPGSYTGLRIGVSTAKGLCYALNKPLIAVDTLQALTFGTIRQINNLNALYCPMIDARRMEVYTALYDCNLNSIEPASAQIVNENFFIDYLNKQKIVFTGNGATKCRQIIKHPNALFAHEFNCSAKNMIVLSEKKFRARQFEDVAYFEPFYLKSFEFKKANR